METIAAQIIGAKYALGQCLATTEGKSVYETSYRDYPAIIKIIPVETTENAHRLLAGFSVARDLQHPHLIAIYDYGEDVVSDRPVVYVVMERADENLAAVLRDRTLDESEANEVRAGVTAALEFLHSRGYIHGGLQPTEVLACGDTLKLSSDRLRSSGEGSAGPDSDFASLADLMAKASGHEAAAPAPEPAAPVNDPPRYHRLRRIAIGGAVAAALLCTLLIRNAHHSAPAPAAPAQAVSAPATEEPSVPLPAASYIPAGWAVIGAAYHREGDAEKRAAKIRAAHPALRIRVLSPDANDRRFLLVFASGLTEAEARRELIRVRRAGAPRDSYLSHFR